MRVYGPYYRKDGRQHVILISDNGSRRTVSYPKWLVEQRLGRELGPDETVDHLDRDFNNNDPSNLAVKPRSLHAKEDVNRAKAVPVKCVTCGKTASRRGSQVNANAKQGHAGPFCKRCAGRYGAELQNGRVARLPAQATVKPEYFKMDKPG